MQDSSQAAIPEAIAALNKDIEKCQDELTSIKATEKEARDALAALEAKPRLSQLRQDIHQLEEERAVIHARLQELHGGDEVQIPVEERARLEQEWKQWQRHVTTRRRICRELWGLCTEVLPEDMTSQDLWVSVVLFEDCSISAGPTCKLIGLGRNRSGLKGRSNKRRSGSDAPLGIASSLHPHHLTSMICSWREL